LATTVSIVYYSQYRGATEALAQAIARGAARVPGTDVQMPMRMTGGNYSSCGSEDDLNRMAGYLGVMAQANIDEPPELAPPRSDILTTEMHGHHIASVTRQYAYSRRELPSDYDTLGHNHTSRPASLAELMPDPLA